MNKIFYKIRFNTGNKLYVPSDNVRVRNHKIYILNKSGLLITDFNHVETIELVEESSLLNFLPGLELALDKSIEGLSV